ncbi:Methicillin resistance regulatory protein MecI [Pseudobythopirellula maris]|uniref:Methicillin resistance regulatory protein MecI n=1 Tax=Pseudobythopirellula maris TaxID=2527991 RepID=A0A5C5ZXD5_9BACT|nr:BlaI/MecI/CopY family transcriptional regulator [Pseudobythopirellula maris]TWT90953.1 Methicillin resistance regulatory protein MecI [Pseudobythopirellula maris]
MARPKAPELTERELELMHVFWEKGPMTAPQAREQLAESGRDLAYTTVATLIKILVDKRFLKQTGDQRPFVYQSIRSFDAVSKRLVSDLVRRVFQGSREELLVQLLDGRKLSQKERETLQQILGEGQS